MHASGLEAVAGMGHVWWLPARCTFGLQGAPRAARPLHLNWQMRTQLRQPPSKKNLWSINSHTEVPRRLGDSVGHLGASTRDLPCQQTSNRQRIDRSFHVELRWMVQLSACSKAVYPVLLDVWQNSFKDVRNPQQEDFPTQWQEVSPTPRRTRALVR